MTRRSHLSALSTPRSLRSLPTGILAATFTLTTAFTSACLVDGDTGAATDPLSVAGGTMCTDLIAGQHIDAGDVCVSADDDNLYVDFTAQNGWEILESHLWVGFDLADMPQTPTGNPKLGNFPYSSQDDHAYVIPLTDLGDPATFCDETLLAVAHAALRKDNGDGTHQTETGYGDGSPIDDQGSWGMYFEIPFVCEPAPEPEPEPMGCETAFAMGGTTLDSLPHPDDPTRNLTERWGWQLGPISLPSAGESDMYAGAAHNDPSRGALVGELSFLYREAPEGCVIDIDYTAAAGYTFTETHLYVGTSNITTDAPGQFGHLHEMPAGTTHDSYSVVAPTCEDLYVVAHAVSCGL
jgi:hypothetical protein